jgi:hypothetical protein
VQNKKVQTCAICQDNVGPENVAVHFDPNDYQGSLNCHFHADCLAEAVKRKDACPICRSGINPESILTPREMGEMRALRKAEEDDARQDQVESDRRAAQDLAAEAEDLTAAVGDGIDQLVVNPEVQETLAAIAAGSVAQEEELALALALSLSGSGAGVGGAGAGAARPPSPPPPAPGLRRRPAPGAAPARAPAAARPAAPHPGGMAEIMSDGCNQALATVAVVATVVAVAALSVLMSNEGN